MTRLLVLRLSALGDVIHTIPAVALLRDAADEIRWVVEAPYRELVEIVAGVTAVPVRMKPWGRSPIASRTDIAAARRAMRGVDVSIDFQGLVKSAALGWLSGAPVRIGFDRTAIREKAALPFTNHRVAVDTSQHVVDQNTELAHWSGGLLASRNGVRRAESPPLQWDQYPLNANLDAFAGKVVLLPGAGKVNKLWPVERFRQLAQIVGEKALVVWGPGERELGAAIGAAMAPPTNLRELAWILQKAQLVIGADTGPLHLAAALGTTVIGLYGPTNPRRNGPYGQLDHCIDHFRTTKLMDSITVEEVVNAIEKVSAA